MATDAAGLQHWLRYTTTLRPLTTISLAILPMRLSSSDEACEALEAEVKEQDTKSISEQTNTVMREVVQEEKRNEANDARENDGRA